MIRKTYRAIKGVSPVLATMVLIVVAVVAGLIVYAWVIGWIGAQKQQVAFTVRVIRTSEHEYTVEIKNVGTTTVTLTCVTVTDPDGTDTYTTSSFTPDGTLAPGESATATVSNENATTENVGTEVIVTVECDKGAFSYKVAVE